MEVGMIVKKISSIGDCKIIEENQSKRDIGEQK